MWLFPNIKSPFIRSKSIAFHLDNPSRVRNESALLALGVQKYEKGDYRGALADYNRAISIDPNYADAYYNRGVLKQAKLNDTPGAIQINPNYADAYTNRGVLKTEKLNDTPGALADYNRAIQINPNLADVCYNRGILKYKKMNDRVGGINDIKQAAKLFQQQGNIQGYQISINTLKLLQQKSEN